MKETSTFLSNKGKVSTNGRIKPGMKDSLKTTWCLDKLGSSILRTNTTKERYRMAKEKAMESIDIQMETSSKDNGKMMKSL
jgi:hypothetical protein